MPWMMHPSTSYPDANGVNVNGSPGQFSSARPVHTVEMIFTTSTNTPFQNTLDLAMATAGIVTREGLPGEQINGNGTMKVSYGADRVGLALVDQTNRREAFGPLLLGAPPINTSYAGLESTALWTSVPTECPARMMTCGNARSMATSVPKPSSTSMRHTFPPPTTYWVTTAWTS